MDARLTPRDPSIDVDAFAFFPLKCLSVKAAGYFMQMRPLKCNVLLKVLCLLAQMYSKTNVKRLSLVPVHCY